MYGNVSKKNLVKMLKSLNKKLIIIWMNNKTPKMIPVRCRVEVLEKTLW